jgi:site-specific DNA-cytosine methylase
MKRRLVILLTFFVLSIYGQEEKIEMISKFDSYEFGSREFIIENFQGIEKLNISFANSEIFLGKNFKIIIRKYKNGKIEIEKNVIDTKNEGLPKIGKNFNFSIVSQHILQNEKIAFYFPNFFNKQIFEINKKFKDGTFLLRDVCGNESEKIDFEVGKETQIALITPPNNNPSKGNLGYCEVSKGNIDVVKWYEKYKISEFFLLYLIIEE